jgi:hypothetical protein
MNPNLIEIAYIHDSSGSMQLMRERRGRRLQRLRQVRESPEHSKHLFHILANKWPNYIV